VTFEHGKDKNLGALNAIDDSIRAEKHFANMLATTGT
jgi:hypothetical protein